MSQDPDAPWLEADPPAAADFVAQLVPQLLADLDGVLFVAEAVQDDSLELLAAEAARGAPRGAGLRILVAAALAAHGELVEKDAAVADAELQAALDALVPAAHAQGAALTGHAERLERCLAMSEPERPTKSAQLGLSIVRFYRALSDGDDGRAHAAMIELRALTVHLDAMAAALEEPSFTPRRSFRPDHFHDWFMRYASLAQAPDLPRAEEAVATLSREGRISAVVTAEQHPVEAAAAAVRSLIPGDERSRDDALARIRALLEFIDGLRTRPTSAQGDRLGDVTRDADVHLSLVLAAAAAPLSTQASFRPATLLQLARFNQQLLSEASRGRPPTAH